MNKRIAIYPGSFDPITNGHLDILKRASNLFDEVYVLIAQNFSKKTTFTFEERVLMVKDVVKEMPNIKVATSSGLTVEFAKSVGACAIIRGLRALNDFEVEFQMSLMNQQLDSSVESVFLMAKQENTFISSSLIKELAMHKQNISHLVPEIVNKYLVEKYK